MCLARNSALRLKWGQVKNPCHSKLINSLGKYECYFVPVTAEKHKTLEVDYQVVDGGNLDVSFMLILGADILAQDTQKTDGSHKYDKPNFKAS